MISKIAESMVPEPNSRIIFSWHIGRLLAAASDEQVFDHSSRDRGVSCSLLAILRRIAPTAVTPKSDESAVRGGGARPFLKWVGGKRQLLGHLLPLLDDQGSSTYYEPFLGGGAVFFGKRAAGHRGLAVLSDVNEELIETYKAIRDDVAGVMTQLRLHATQNCERYFYETRSATPARAVDVAARMIYLNKTCFNGLYRVNRSGGFNSPWGRYLKPTICDESNLRLVSAELQTTRLTRAPFEDVVDRACQGDTVYFDPPYVPASATASFTGYSAIGFGPKDQSRLADVVGALDRRGVRVIVSNSDTPNVRRLYEGRGLRILDVLARRAVNTRGDRRGPVGEVIVHNL